MWNWTKGDLLEWSSLPITIPLFKCYKDEIEKKYFSIPFKLEEKKSRVLNRMERNAFHHIPLFSLLFQSILPNNGVLLWIHVISSTLYHIWGWHTIICFNHTVWTLTFLLKKINYMHVWICGEFEKITVEKLHFQQNQCATVIPTCTEMILTYLCVLW